MVNVSQAFRMYEMVNKYLKNSEDAKAIVLGIEGIIDEKVIAAKDIFATKEDLFAIKEDLFATKEDLTKEINKLETRMEQNFKEQLKWIIALMFTFSGLIIALIKCI